MAFPQYLAMTGAEYANAPVHPPHLGWMALHFSAYGTGLSNFPPTLPENAMLLVNDRTPISGHDPHLISQQLQQITQEQNCACVLLDFQRPGCPETQAVVEAVLHTLSCPVGVSEHYANGVSSPVFLPPVPLRTPISDHLAPWKDREIWLETTNMGEEVTITPEGTQTRLLQPLESPKDAHYEERFLCHYTIEVADRCIRFRLFRTPEDQEALRTAAQSLYVTKTIGLYQEFPLTP